jgi:hypothetical protein
MVNEYQTLLENLREEMDRTTQSFTKYNEKIEEYRAFKYDLADITNMLDIE